MSAGANAWYGKNAKCAVQSRVMRRFMTAASVSALVIAAPVAFFSPVAAEPVPAGCTDSGGNGQIDDNETITCISGSLVSEISSVLDDSDPTDHAVDLTVVIGDATTPTNVSSGSGENYGVLLGAGGSVTVYNAASTVSGFYNGINAATDVIHPYDITINSEGTISGGSGIGIRTESTGSGDTTINVVDVLGGNDGIRAENINVSDGDISIMSSGDITSSGGTGIRATNASAAGSTYINVVDVSGGGSTDQGIYAYNEGVDLTIISSGRVYGADNGISAYNHGTGATIITVQDVDAGQDAIVVETDTSTTGDITVTTSGGVSALRDGVRLEQNGVGATDLSVYTVDADRFGVVINAAAGTIGDVSLTATGAIDAGADGVQVDNDGAGSVYLNVGDVTAGSGVFFGGINVENDGTDIDIISTGVITSDKKGVIAENNGSGATTVSVYDVTSADEGVAVRSAASTTGAVSVTAMGTISAGKDGVFVDQDGSGGVSITVEDVNVSGFNEAGILVRNEGADLSIVSNATIIAGGRGVAAVHDGNGATNISTNAITSDREAIYLRSYGGATTIAANGALSAQHDGIKVYQYDGNVNVTVDAITADRQAIDIISYASNTGDISVTAGGALSSTSDDGVYINNSGSGDVSVHVADVTAGAGSNDIGIEVLHDGGALSVTSTGLITAGGHGVDATSDGTGALSVSVDGIDSGRDGVWAFLDNASATSDITVIADGHIEAGGAGVAAVNFGTGGVDVSVDSVNAGFEAAFLWADDGSTGDINLTAAGALVSDGNYAIGVYQYGSGDTTINVADVTTTGEYDAVLVQHTGGVLSFTSDGAITSAGYGVKAYNTGTGDTTISVRSVTADYGAGIVAQNENAGALSISATGLISAQAIDGDYAGVGVWADAQAGGDVTVDVADVYGQTYGVYVQSTGGAVNVTAEDVKGYYNVGVRVYQSAGAGDVSVTTAGAVTSDQGRGVYVSNYGTGATAVHVNSIESAGGGINAYSSASAAGNDVTVTASGDIKAGDYGIFASTSGYGGVNISANNIDAGARGILAVVFAGSTGDVNVTTSGAVVAQDRNAIGVFNSGYGDTIIDVNDVTAVAEYAALSVLHGGGDFSVNAAGTLTSGGYGVTAFTFGTGATTINVENINAEYGGLDLTQSEGAGDVSITATGAVASNRGNGVYVENLGTGATAIAVNSVAANDGNGVVAFSNQDGGGLTITATGDVRAYGEDDSTLVFSPSSGFYALPAGVGILAVSIDNGATVAADTVYGALDGVNVINVISGAVAVSAVDVTGGTRDGVYVNNSARADTVLTVTGVATGERHGIRAWSLGSEGALVITANDVSSVSDDAINAYKGSYGYDEGDIAITTAGAVFGGADGIDARGIGLGAVTIASNAVSGVENGVNAYAYSGAVSITTSGTVTATNADGVRADRYGLFRYDDDSSYQDRFGVDEPFVNDVSVSVATVTGADRGIYATNGNGGVSITVAGAVTGEGGEGILSVATTGTQITINDGGSVAGVGAALRTAGDVSDVLSLSSGGSINGDARLLAGNDVFNDAGGDFTNVFGGDGADTVNFAASAARTIIGSGGTGDALQEFEVFNFDAGGFTLAGAHTGLSETNFNAGFNTLTGTLTSTETTIAAGATLNKADGSTINGNLTVNGTLDIGNSPGTSIVDGDVVFGATSVLPIETLGDAHDTLIVTGSVMLDGEIQIIHLGDLEVGTTRRTIIDADREIIGSHATVAGEQGLLISNSVDFDSSGFDLILTTTVNSALSVDGLTDDELSVGDHLLSLLAQPSIDPELAGLINAIGVIPNVGDLNAVLAELHPEGFDGGLQYAANSQGRFVSNVIDVPAHALRHAGPDGVYAWSAVDLSRLSKNEDSSHVGFDGNAYEFSAGVSGLGRGPLSFGFAGGYARFEGDTKAGLHDAIDVSLYRLAGSMRLAIDGVGVNGHIDNVVSFSSGENSLAMSLVDPVSGAPLTQSGEADIESIGYSTRFTFSGVDNRAWPIQTHAEVGLDAIRQDAVSVRSDGASATALEVEELESMRSHVAFGAAIDRQIGKSLSLNASAEGVRYFGDTENVIEARFAAAPDGVPAFRTIGANVEWQTRMRAGAAYEHKSGFILSADAFGEVGDLNAYGGRVELSRRF